MRSKLCIFIGYAANCKGYLCMTKSSKVYISCHVIFNEFLFPYQTSFVITSVPPTPYNDSVPRISLIPPSHKHNASCVNTHYTAQFILHAAMPRVTNPDRSNATTSTSPTPCTDATTSAPHNPPSAAPSVPTTSHILVAPYLEAAPSLPPLTSLPKQKIVHPMVTEPKMAFSNQKCLLLFSNQHLLRRQWQIHFGYRL